MKRKILIFIIVFLVIIQTNCNNNNSGSSERKQLLKTDKEFAEFSFDNGMPDAFINYAADDAILLRGDRTLFGIKEIKKYFNERRDLRGTLYWIPLKAEVSGNIGYTFGEWKFFLKDSANNDTSYGNYMSIWKKQDDGNWKYIMDGGNSNQAKNIKKN